MNTPLPIRVSLLFLLPIFLSLPSVLSAQLASKDDTKQRIELNRDELTSSNLVPGELVVTIHKDGKREDLEMALKNLEYKTKVLDEILASNMYLISVPAEHIHECRLRLGIHPYIEACGLNVAQIQNRTFNDPALATDNDNGWNLRRINVFDAWDITTGDAKVAVVDSGIKLDHEEFRGKLTEPYSVVNRSSAMQTGLVKVKQGEKLVDKYVTEHGTHVAGTAAGKAGNSLGSAGVAPNSPIMPIQSLSYVAQSQGIFGQDWALVQGLNRAMNKGAKVINYSIGGPPPSNLVKRWEGATTTQAKATAETQIMGWVRRNLNDGYVGVLDRAIREGVIIVKSSGNDNLPAKFDYLSYSQRVISVAATNKKDGRAIFGNGFASNYGEFTTVSAPGQEIWNAYSNPNVPYGTMQGTSMAAPHVAGVVALMKTIDPPLSRKEAADILISTGKKLETDRPIGPLINAAAAVKELKRRRENNVPRPEPDQPLITPRPNPCDPVLPRNGVEICRGPRPWENPDVRRLIDLWLCIALPVIGDRDPRGGPYFWDRFGRVVTVRVIYILPPPDYVDTRYQWLWENAAKLKSRNFDSLSVFVVNTMKSGRFNPAPVSPVKLVDKDVPKDDPSDADGVHPVTTTFKGLAGSFEWKQNKGSDTATVVFNMSGSEAVLLQKHGLPAKVTVTAKKEGGKFVVPAGNPLSTALTTAGANLSKSVGGTPSKINVSMSFTPNGKSVEFQSKISFGN